MTSDRFRRGGHRIALLVGAAAFLLVAFLPPVNAVDGAVGGYTSWFWPTIGSTEPGFSDFTQTVSVLSTTPDAGYFWAQQFAIQAPRADQGVGYLGLQSAGNRRLDGSVGNLAIFSIWDAIDARGTACGIFAESTPGFSCGLAYAWKQQVPYRYRLAKGASDATGTWWAASVTDTQTAVTTLIGEIKVPSWWGGLFGMGNFTEYFKAKASQPCPEVPYSRTRFGTPTANNGEIVPTGQDNYTSTTNCNAQSYNEPGGVIHDLGNRDLGPVTTTTTTSTTSTTTTPTTPTSPTTVPVAPAGSPKPPIPEGYWLTASDGGIFAFGRAGYFGSLGDVRLRSPVVGMAPTPTGKGYWLVAADGGIFALGDAPFWGSAGAIQLNSPIVGMAATPKGDGYWLVAADGGIFNFGPGAPYLGSAGGTRLNSPIVGMAASPKGSGYWLVAADGGVFNFGPGARFFGSAGDLPLTRPIVGVAITSTGSGYWLVASDGGVFNYGDARFFGSTGATRLTKPIVGIETPPARAGYWLVASDGGVFAFGDAGFHGSTGSLRLNKPIAGLAAS
jgi:hypothetical protein